MTDSNKLRYLDSLAQFKLANCVKDEIEAFLKGLNELIPDNLLSMFDENELEVRSYIYSYKLQPKHQNTRQHHYNKHKTRFNYSQTLPCGHLFIVDTCLQWTVFPSPAKNSH